MNKYFYNGMEFSQDEINLAAEIEELSLDEYLNKNPKITTTNGNGDDPKNFMDKIKDSADKIESLAKDKEPDKKPLVAKVVTENESKAKISFRPKKNCLLAVQPPHPPTLILDV